MAVPTGTFKTYEAIGNREDLADMVYDISPTETPLVSNIGRGSATHTKTEWQTDVLESATAGNKVLEGDDATTDTATPTVRLANICQISDKVPRVSGTQESMDSAGRRSEMSYQVAKRGKELKRDIEKTLCGKQAADDASAATARAAAGLATYLWDNQVQIGIGTTQTIVAVTAGFPTTAVVDGTADTLTEQNLKDAIALAWDDGGEPNMVLCGSHNKQRISGFTGIATQYRDNPKAAPATIIGAADVYVSDFGTVNIVPSRFTPANVVYVIDTSTLEAKYLRPIQMTDLAKTGDSLRKQLLAEYTLCVKSPSANAIIHTTTTS